MKSALSLLALALLGGLSAQASGSQPGTMVAYYVLEISCEATLSGPGTGTQVLQANSDYFDNSDFGFSKSSTKIPVGDYQVAASVGSGVNSSGADSGPTFTAALVGLDGRVLSGNVASHLDPDSWADGESTTLTGSEYVDTVVGGDLVQHVQYSCTLTKTLLPE